MARKTTAEGIPIQVIEQDGKTSSLKTITAFRKGGVRTALTATVLAAVAATATPAMAGERHTGIPILDTVIGAVVRSQETARTAEEASREARDAYRRQRIYNYEQRLTRLRAVEGMVERDTSVDRNVSAWFMDRAWQENQRLIFRVISRIDPDGSYVYDYISYPTHATKATGSRRAYLAGGDLMVDYGALGSERDFRAIMGEGVPQSQVQIETAATDTRPAIQTAAARRQASTSYPGR